MSKVQIPDYPDNSNATKAKESEEKKEIAVQDQDKKVIQGKAKVKKKGLGKKFSETVFAEDADSVGSYLISDVLAPAAKDTFVDFMHKGVEMLIYGDTRASSSGYHKRSSRDDEYYSYDNHSRRDRGRSESRRPARRRRSLIFDDITFETRGDAERALDELFDRLDTYRYVTVADLYDVAEISHDFTYEKWGWTDLDPNIRPRRCRDGSYMIPLPKAEYLDND